MRRAWHLITATPTSIFTYIQSWQRFFPPLERVLGSEPPASLSRTGG
jgi:hypothetical protein